MCYPWSGSWSEECGYQKTSDEWMCKKSIWFVGVIKVEQLKMDCEGRHHDEYQVS